MNFLRKLGLDPLDVLHVLGFAAMIWGIWQLNHPAAWIAGGVLVIFYSYLVSAGRRHIEP
jgi:4-hydroxybenzoate polyprenyltransferase